MTPPNILLLFTDQQRADTIAALGNPVIRTPNLDRLVREGTAFTSAYTPAPECVPARCCMMFGQYPGKNRCYGNGSPMPWDERENLMSALGRASYHTHGIGKCHFTPGARADTLNGFDGRERQEEIVGGAERDDYLRFLQANGGAHITDPHGVRGEMYYVPQPAQMPAAFHPTQWVGDRSVDFLRGRAAGGKPWFLFSSFVHPHPPFAPPAPWHKLYRDLDMPLPHTPEGCERLLVFVNRQQNRYKRRDRGVDLHLLRTMRAYYYACVSFVDYQVGRIVAALEERGELENTLILFSSDHGELLGDYRSFGKRSFHDAASRIPLLARGPGVAPGYRCDTPVSLVDVTATCLQAAGTAFKTHACDGKDLLGLAATPCAPRATDKPSAAREAAGPPGGAACAAASGGRDGGPAVLGPGDRHDRLVFSQLNRAGYGLYTALNRRWKFVYSAPDQRELLFDRVRDPGETHDLADALWQPEWPSSRAQAEMRRALVAWLKEQGEEAALDGEKLRTYPKREMPENPDAWLIYQDHPWADQRVPGYEA